MIPWFRARVFPTRSAVALSMCALAYACGGAAGSPPAAAAAGARPSPGGRAASLRKLQQNSRTHADRIAELEVRLALLEAELHEMRAIACPEQGSRGQTIRIGGGPKPEEAMPSAGGTEQEGGHPRPVLRLYGSRPRGSGPGRSAAPLLLPRPPSGVPQRLPVVPLPDSDRGAIPLSPVTSSQNGDRARHGDGNALSQYRTALALLRNRRYDQALEALAAFLVRYPNSAHSDNAMYWRGEAYYAKRRYQDAIAEFEALAARFPSSEKVADALLKVGMCHRRLGNSEEARGLFRRVRREFPDTEAARIASQEGSS